MEVIAAAVSLLLLLAVLSVKFWRSDFVKATF